MARPNTASPLAGSALLDAGFRTLVLGVFREELPGVLAEALDARPAEVNRLLTRQVLAERLGVSERTLDTLRGEGMPTVWVLESPRFEFAAVVEWLKTRPAKGRAE